LDPPRRGFELIVARKLRAAGCSLIDLAWPANFFLAVCRPEATLRREICGRVPN